LELEPEILMNENSSVKDEELINLKRQNVILENRVNSFQNYIKQLAHDLKTPLTPLVGASELLASGFNEQPWSDLAQSIKMSAENLLKMVDELLDLELCESGMLKLNLSGFNPVKPVREETKKVEAGLSPARATITLNLPSAPLMVWGDEFRLRQVISIFISNALKFSPHGGNLTVSIVPDNATIEFVVEDDGTTIAPADLPYIFEPYRGSDGQRRRTGNNSLALAKKLVGLQGGHIGAKSAPEQRNALWFDLPVDKSTVLMGAV
jgi:signal transduction histidine kinase